MVKCIVSVSASSPGDGREGILHVNVYGEKGCIGFFASQYTHILLAGFFSRTTSPLAIRDVSTEVNSVNVGLPLVGMLVNH